MLQAIRSKTASIVVKALAGLLIISFAAWGIEDFISARATDVGVATVGPNKIDPLEFEYELARESDRMRQTFGGQLTQEQLIGLGIGNAVLQRMINEQALSIRSKEMGLMVSDDQVTRTIHNDPTFHGFDGKFSRTRFNEVMRANGLPEPLYIEQTRTSIANEQLLSSIISSSTIPKKMSELLRAYRFESRSAETFTIAAADQAFDATPSDSDLDAIYKDQASRFTAPEYRRITYVHLNPELLMNDVEISQEDLQAAFDANADTFIKPEQRVVQQIVVTSEEKAQEVSKQLSEGRDFVEVATEVAEMEQAAVDLGSVTQEGLLPDLANAVFAVDAGAVTAPVKSPLGWHILKAVSVEAGITNTLDEVRDDVRLIVAKERAIDALYDLSVRFEDAIGGGATLEEAGNEVGMAAKTIEAVERQGNTPSGARASLPELASLLPLAFAADQGIESELTEVGDKGFYMLRVDAITAPALRPLADVRADVVAAWEEKQRTELAEKKTKAIVDQVNGGAMMETVAADNAATVEKVGPITRGDRGQVSPAVLAKMFELPNNKAGLARVGNDYVVVKLTGIQSPDSGGDAPSASELSQQLSGDVGRDLAAQMISAIRDELGVGVNQRVFDAVLEPGNFDPYQPL